MDAAIQNKVNAWLNGNFDQATKDEVIKLQKAVNKTAALSLLCSNKKSQK